MAIVSRLKHIMKERGIRLDDLAREVGISKINLSRMSSGRIKATRFSSADSLCKALDCQLGDIFVYVPDDQLTEKDVVCYIASDEDDLLD